MKKIFAAALISAITWGGVYAETHETLKAHSLKTSVGDISFGAWGRSTFEMGRNITTSKVSVDGGESDANFRQTYALLKSSYETMVAAEAAYKKAAVAYGRDPSNDTASSSITFNTGSDVDTAFKAWQIAAQSFATAAGSNADLAGMLCALYSMENSTKKSKGFASISPDWSYGSRVGFWIIGRTPDEKYGFDFNLDADAHALFVHKLYDADEAAEKVNYNEDGKYAVAIGDQAKIWGLFDSGFGLQNKVAFGKMREQELRGSIGDFGQRESGDVKSEDDIFSEFWPTTGLFVSTKGEKDTLFEGFYAAGSIDLSGKLGISSTDTDRNTDEDMSFYEAMRTAQAGIGYTIPGIAQLKAQYWGDSISEKNYRYATSTYKAARNAGFGLNDYYGRMEFGIDWLGFMGGATSFLDPALDLDKTPNANLIEVGFKLPIVTDKDLRDYDPEKFYNWYSCIGTMGVIQKGFILYKGHIWGGQGVSNLGQYTDISGSGDGLLTMAKGDGAKIFMAGFDFLAEVCLNPFGKQDVFVGLSGNYNITAANADGNASVMGIDVELNDLKLRQHNIGAEIYVKKTFAANNYMFAGIADRFTMSTMDGNLNGMFDLSYKATGHKIYMPIGVEMFF